MIKFSEDFKFGAATSGPQSEGTSNKKYLSSMDQWSIDEPYRFYDNIGSDKVSNTRNMYKEDVKLMKEIGLESFRTSIQWSRIFIDIDKGIINEDEVNYYLDYFKLIKESGIELVVNLFHFDMPVIYEELGGFLNIDIVDKYVEFAEVCYKHFDLYVDKWCTFNEPLGYTSGVYLGNYFPPHQLSFSSFVQANFNLIYANARVCEVIKNTPVGIILDGVYVYPRSNNACDLLAKELCEELRFYSVFDPAIKGTFKEGYLDKYNISYTQDMLEVIANNTNDFIGVNYYGPHRVMAPVYAKHEDSIFLEEHLYVGYDLPNKRINPYRGWEIFPLGVYDIAMKIKEEYGDFEWYLSENGMGVMDEERFIVDGVINDDYRISFVKEHLVELNRAIEAGCNCKGYHMWTFIDCWGWGNAFKNRYGFVSLDYATSKRSIKKSGYWYKELSTSRCFDESE